METKDWALEIDEDCAPIRATTASYSSVFPGASGDNYLTRLLQQSGGRQFRTGKEGTGRPDFNPGDWSFDENSKFDVTNQDGHELENRIRCAIKRSEKEEIKSLDSFYDRLNNLHSERRQLMGDIGLDARHTRGSCAGVDSVGRLRHDLDELSVWDAVWNKHQNTTVENAGRLQFPNVPRKRSLGLPSPHTPKFSARPTPRGVRTLSPVTKKRLDATRECNLSYSTRSARGEHDLPSWVYAHGSRMDLSSSYRHLHLSPRHLGALGARGRRISSRRSKKSREDSPKQEPLTLLEATRKLGGQGGRASDLALGWLLSPRSDSRSGSLRPPSLTRFRTPSGDGGDGASDVVKEETPESMQFWSLLRSKRETLSDLQTNPSAKLEIKDAIDEDSSHEETAPAPEVSEEDQLRQLVEENVKEMSNHDFENRIVLRLKYNGAVDAASDVYRRMCGSKTADGPLEHLMSDLVRETRADRFYFKPPWDQREAWNNVKVARRAQKDYESLSQGWESVLRNLAPVYGYDMTEKNKVRDVLKYFLEIFRVSFYMYREKDGLCYGIKNGGRDENQKSWDDIVPEEFTVKEEVFKGNRYGVGGWRREITDDPIYTMALAQFWRMAKNACIVDGTFSLVFCDYCFQLTRAETYRPPSSSEPLAFTHDPLLQMNIFQYVETIVRIADLKFDEGGVSDRLRKLMREHIRPHMYSGWTYVDESLSLMLTPQMQRFLYFQRDSMRKIFVHFGTKHRANQITGERKRRLPIKRLKIPGKYLKRHVAQAVEKTLGHIGDLESKIESVLAPPVNPNKGENNKETDTNDVTSKPREDKAGGVSESSKEGGITRSMKGMRVVDSLVQATGVTMRMRKDRRVLESSDPSQKAGQVEDRLYSDSNINFNEIHAMLEDCFFVHSGFTTMQALRLATVVSLHEDMYPGQHKVNLNTEMIFDEFIEYIVRVGLHEAGKKLTSKQCTMDEVISVLEDFFENTVYSKVRRWMSTRL
eukprot:Rmarinus@m.29351